LIAKLEAGLKIISLPKQTSYQLTQYDRYYAGVTVNGRRQIHGKWIVPPNREDNPKTGIHITDMKYMPFLRACLKPTESLRSIKSERLIQ
jgi:hypothetical protein